MQSGGSLDKMLSVKQAAERLGLKPGTIRLWVKLRTIAHVKLGSRVLIPASECERLLRDGYVPARDDNKVSA